MKRTKAFIQALVGLAVFAGLTIALIGLFSSASDSQTTSQPEQTISPTTDTPATATTEPTLAGPTDTSTPEPSPTQPAPEPGSAGILYESGGELYWQPVDEAGRAIALAAHVPLGLAAGSKVGKLFPAPDGSQIVYEVYALPPEGCCEYYASLYIFSPPNGQPRQIDAPAPIAGIFGWHPNSKQLVYGTDNGLIGLFDVNSGERTLIAEPQKWADLPYGPVIHGLTLSPDGAKLAVSFTLSGQEWEIWTANIDGTEPLFLFKEGYGIAGLAWSPDGKWIAFVGNGLEVIRPDGQNRRTVGTGFTGGAFPAWSPDSRYIAFTAGEFTPQGDTGYNRVRIAEIASGTEKNLLGATDKGEVLPVWSPDGSKLLFLSARSDENDASEVWVVNLDGTGLQQLTFDGQSKRSVPVWLPASGR